MLRHQDIHDNLINYNKNLKEDQALNVSAIAGTGDLRLPLSQREPAFPKKKLRHVIRKI